jgi:hypothetical protein
LALKRWLFGHPDPVAGRDKNQGDEGVVDDSEGMRKLVAMLEYVLDGHHYSLSYQSLREEYHRFCQMTDEEFMKQLPAATHLACVICFLKEVPTYVALCDIGIIHELVHLMHIPDGNTRSLGDIRTLFEQTLHLS